MDKLRVGVCGINSRDNQITRRVQDLGCEAFWIDQDKRHIPHFLDAIILTPTQNSHGRFYEVKDFAKAHKIPLFLTRAGFSDIANEFQEFVLKMKRGIKPQVSPPLSTMGTAMQLALQPQPETKKEEVVQQHGPVLSYDRIEQLYKQGLKPVKIAKILKAEGYRNNRGEPINAPAIAAIHCKDQTPDRPTYRGKPPEVEPKVKAQSTPLKQQAANVDTAFLQRTILEANIPDAVKLSRLRAVIEGKITNASVVESEVVDGVLVLHHYHLISTEGTTVELTKDQAELIVKSSEQIINFIQGHK